jgi:integrase
MWVERNGKTWRIRDEVAGRKVDLEVGHPTKTSAKAALIRLQAEKMRGDQLVPRGDRVLVKDHIAAWWARYERTLKPSARDSEGARLRNHILPLLGEYALGDLDALAVQEWVDDLEAGVGEWLARGKRIPLSPKSIHNAHGLLHRAMRAAISPAKLIRVNPCSGTALPRREPREMMHLTDPEIARLIAAMPEYWRPLVRLLVATGLRWGEAVGLRVGRVDLLASPAPKLLVVEHLHELSSGELVFTDPKTRRSRRTVSFTTSVALDLAPLHAGKESDELLFQTELGYPVRARNFRRIWVKAREHAGLPGLRVHDLRHTHAAILIAANRPGSAISRRLGHSSIAVTDALYGHLREEVDEGILAAVEKSLDPAQVMAEVAADL